jgi:hypothetical protein
MEGGSDARDNRSAERNTRETRHVRECGSLPWL